MEFIQKCTFVRSDFILLMIQSLFFFMFFEKHFDNDVLKSRPIRKSWMFSCLERTGDFCTFGVFSINKEAQIPPTGFAFEAKLRHRNIIFTWTESPRDYSCLGCCECGKCWNIWQRSFQGFRSKISTFSLLTTERDFLDSALFQGTGFECFGIKMLEFTWLQIVCDRPSQCKHNVRARK